MSVADSADASAAGVEPRSSGGAAPAPRVDPLDVMRRLVKVCFWISMALCLTLPAFKVATRFNVGTLWDDAYMFQRYAHNVVTDHQIAWNPGGAPTYGLTSLLFLVVAVPLHVVTGGNVSLAVMLQSFVCGLALIGLLVVLVRRAAGATRAAQLGCFFLVSFCVAVSTLADHFVSGMDTTFGLCFLAIHLLLAMRLERAPSVKGALLLGVVGGLAFSVRPELTAFSVAVPLALAALQRGPARRLGAIALAATLGVLACHLAIAALYFGTPLPLPFYAKSTNLYGAGIGRAYRGKSTIDLLDWAQSFWPLCAVVVLDVLAGAGDPARPEATIGPRAWWRGSSPLDKGVLAATAICVGYAWLFVVPIMGYSQRFFYPSLPGLIYLACRSATRLLRSLEDAIGRQAPRVLPALAAVAMAWSWSSLSPLLTAAGRDLTGAVSSRALGRFSLAQHVKSQGPQKLWFAIDRFSELPDDVEIATTEVGIVGAANLGKRFIDMAGLNDRDYALQRFSAERFFGAHRPDLIYMPHPDYVEMTDALQKSPEMSGYALYTAAQLKAALGVAIRKDSPHFAEMQQIMRQRLFPSAIGK